MLYCRPNYSIPPFDEEIQQTGYVEGGGKNPIWDEETHDSNLTLKYHGDVDGKIPTLIIESWDHNTGRKDDYIGQSRIALDDILLR